MIKRISLIIILVCILLSSCNNRYALNQNDASDENLKYVYSEKKVYSTDEKVTLDNLKACGKDELMGVSINTTNGMHKLTKYNSDFKEVAFPASDILNEKMIDIYSLDNERNIYVINYQLGEPLRRKLPEGREISIYSYEGKFVRKISLDNANTIKDSSGIKKILVYDEHIYLISTSGIQITDMDGKSILEISKNIIDADILNDYIFTIGRDGSRYIIEKINSNTGETTWKKQVENESDYLSIIWCDKENNSFYTQSNNYIYRYNADGERTDTMIDFFIYDSGIKISESGHISGIVSNKNYLYAIIPSKASSFQIDIFRYELLDGDVAKRFKDKYNQERKSKPTLKIFVPSRDLSLEKQALLFGNSNNINIDVIFYRDEAIFGKRMEEYAQYINLQIMSETQWDMIYTRGLPCSTYIQKGILADLDSIDKKKELTNNSKYFMNIIDACRVDGKLYYFPVSYTFQALLADKEYARNNDIELADGNVTWLDLFKQADNMVAAGKSINVFSALSRNFITTSLYTDIFHKVVDFENKNVDFNSELFNNYLDGVKAGSNDMLYSGNPSEKSIFYFENSSKLYANLNNKYSDKEVLPLPRLEGSDCAAYDFQEGYAINKNSDYKEIALDFIKYLADNEIYGTSPSRKAYESYIKKFNTPDAKSQIDAITRIIESLNTCYTFNTINSGIYEIINKAAEEYINGAVSKEQAVKNLEQRTWQYLNE